MVMVFGSIPESESTVNNQQNSPQKNITMVFRLPPPPQGIDSMNHPNPMHGRAVTLDLMQIVKITVCLIKCATTTRIFDKLLARHRKWWPKRHPSLRASTTNIRIDY